MIIDKSDRLCDTDDIPYTLRSTPALDAANIAPALDGSLEATGPVRIVA